MPIKKRMLPIANKARSKRKTTPRRRNSVPVRLMLGQLCDRGIGQYDANAFEILQGGVPTYLHYRRLHLFLFTSVSTLSILESRRYAAYFANLRETR